jgi:hypothetical protein
MAKFERTAGWLGPKPGNPVSAPLDEAPRRSRGSPLPGTAPRNSQGIPDLRPPAGPWDPVQTPEARPSTGSMTVESSDRDREASRTLDRKARRRSLILTPQERDIVGIRLRELKREVIPPLLRAMQSPNPDPIDRENYHRATNELDWLLEIVQHSARVDRISGLRHRRLRGPGHDEGRKEDPRGIRRGHIRETRIPERS